MWTHYSSSKNLVLTDRKHEQYDIKPRGLYCAHNDDWKKWCKLNDFPLNPYKYIVKISSKANILELTKEKFNELERIDDDILDRINWNNISKQYDGMYIDISKSFLSYDSYHIFCSTFDVNTMIIWNPKVVKLINENISLKS